MPTRRALMLAALGASLAPRLAWTSSGMHEPLAWEAFLEHMQALAIRHATGVTDSADSALQAAGLLHRLDTGSDGFADAVTQSWESGNRYWLWQRLTRTDTMTGGILHIDSAQDVPLHDHPGACGILRVLSGQLELWQFDIQANRGLAPDRDSVELRLAAHRVLQPGDTAVLEPDHANIHALKALSPQCSMLDYFIPPYQRQLRSWFQPLQRDWAGATTVTCRRVPEQEYLMSRHDDSISTQTGGTT